jgi:hypothetical protein
LGGECLPPSGTLDRCVRAFASGSSEFFQDGHRPALGFQGLDLGEGPWSVLRVFGVVERGEFCGELIESLLPGGEVALLAFRDRLGGFDVGLSGDPACSPFQGGQLLLGVRELVFQVGDMLLGLFDLLERSVSPTCLGSAVVVGEVLGVGPLEAARESAKSVVVRLGAVFGWSVVDEVQPGVVAGAGHGDVAPIPGRSRRSRERRRCRR